MSNWTNEKASRLRELEELDADGVKLEASDYEEMRELMNEENADFVEATA